MFFNVYSVTVLLTSLIMSVLSVWSWNFRVSSGAKSFSLAMFAGALYACFYALEISSGTLSLAVLFYHFEYIGIPFIPAFYLLFAVQYSGKKETIGFPMLFAIFTIPVLTLLLALSNNFHSLFVSGMKLETVGPFPSLTFTPGIWYWVHQAYSIVSIVVSMLIFFRMWLYSAPSFKKQYGIILLSSLVPFIIYVVYLLGYFPRGLDPIPFAFAFTGVFIFLGLTRFRLFDLTPLARNILFDKIPDPVIVFDNQLRIVDFNRKASLLFSISQNLIGKPGDQVFYSWPVILYALKDPDSSDFFDLEVNHDGSGNYFNCYFAPLTDKRNFRLGCLLIMQDVTRQRIAEKIRRETEEKFRLIFENAPLGVIYFDREGTLEVCNDYFVELMGSSREKLTGLNLLQLPDLRVARCVREALNGQRVNYEGEYRSVTGNKVTPLKAHFEAIFSENGDLQGGIAIVEDVTERILAEENIKNKNRQLEALNAEKDRFFSIIAHDLRSPIYAFLGIAGLMAEEAAVASQSEMVNMAHDIHESARSLSGLLENLLEWARLQQGLINVNKENVGLHALVNSSVAVLRDSAEKKQIKVINRVPEGIRLCTDENMVSSVLRNFVSNAIKFTQRGGQVSISATTDSEGFITLAVTDTGVGIPPENLSRLFRIDHKIRSRGTDGEPSSGLGLILSNQFVAQLGGKISVSSTVGKGSEFSFTLPVK